MTRKAWRDQVLEAALDPDLPIIDAHHHLWHTPRRAQLEPYDHEALFEDKCESGHNVVATVYVDSFANYSTEGPELLRVVGETKFASGVADLADKRGGCAAGACAAIVSNADLMLGEDVGAILDAHMAASVRFRGVRRMTISDPDVPNSMQPGLMSQDAFHAGFSEVARRGLTFDACVFQAQLPELMALALRWPETPIVLNHLGTPLSVGRYATYPHDAVSEWKKGMGKLAQCKNVVVKLGGLNMPFTGLGAAQDAMVPFGSAELAERQRSYVLTTIDLFGPERCMFESNFPVDMWFVSYTVLWNTFKRITAGFSAAERQTLFAGTARLVYRIP